MEPTQPDYLAQTRPNWVGPPGTQPVTLPPRRRRTCLSCGCLLPLAAGLLLLALYFFAPGRSNLLIIGIDSRQGEGLLGRTDTNILMTVIPLKPYVGMLSIPRDLWVTIPGHGENRINTAHFFAESASPGSGPQAATETVATNLGVPVDNYVRIQFAGLQSVVDALGGIEIELSEPASGFPAGRHHLTGEQALAFVRDRQGTDDFFRMARGQLFLRSAFKAVLVPATWPRLPGVMRALPEFLDTNIPIWLWPRLGVAVLRVGPEGIDNRVIGREQVQPFTTADGAAVLAPQWEQIQPMLEEMFLR